MRRSVHRNGDYMNRIKRAKAQDRVITVIFYCIAVFFFVLLAAFAGYVIIKGFAGAKLSMFGFTRRGAIGNQLFNTIYLVFLSLLITVSTNWNICWNISCKICQGRTYYKVHKNMYRDTFVTSIYCCWFIWLPHLSCNYRTG